MPASNASLRPAFDTLKLLSSAKMGNYFGIAKKMATFVENNWNMSNEERIKYLEKQIIDLTRSHNKQSWSLLIVSIGFCLLAIKVLML